MTCIHEKTDWPDFAWNSETLAAPWRRYATSRGFSRQNEGIGVRPTGGSKSLAALTTGVVKSSAIEGCFASVGRWVFPLLDRLHQFQFQDFQQTPTKKKPGKKRGYESPKGYRIDIVD